MSVLEQPISAHSFIIDQADLFSPYFPQKRFDIKNVILDIDIFEHINKPYLTGSLTIIDDNSLYAGINFRGVESLTLTLRLPDAGFQPITKVFYLDRVVTNQRANDAEAVLMFHMVEDIGFVNEYINVNDGFEGKGVKIIKDMMKRYFDKEVTIDNLITEDVQFPVKVVVPNINPIQAAEWIKDRMTAENGAPFYLFSTLALPELQLRNFQTMIFNPNNTNIPFRYSQALVNKNNLTLDEEMFIIENHSDNETADITYLNESGFVNAKYLFHDVVRNRTFIPGNTKRTRYREGYNNGQNGKRWTAHGLFEIRFFENRPEASPFQQLANPYPSTARLPWSLSTSPENRNPDENPLIHERPESCLVTSIYASSQYGDAFYSYAEGRRDADHMYKIDSKAIRNWIITDPITFTVPGRLFLTGKVNATIGYKYRLEFTTSIGENSFVDTRRSGDYMIYSARHSFTRDHGYRVHLTGVGIGARSLQPRDKIEESVYTPAEQGPQ